MGRGLAENAARHGYRVVLCDQKKHLALRAARQLAAKFSGRVRAAGSLADLIARLPSPRDILMLVPVGDPVQEVIDGLLLAGLAPGDMLLDCTNGFWEDTIAREEAIGNRCVFMHCGISGGEEGARFGPCVMCGYRDDASRQRVLTLWEDLAARIDAKTGRQLTGPQRGIVTRGSACVAVVGPHGAGHFVKNLHNGIEYTVLQLIAETYHLFREGFGYSSRRIQKIFARWTRTAALNSYLLEAAAAVLAIDDEHGHPLVEQIVDTAVQKGTGSAIAAAAFKVGSAAPGMATAVMARLLSGFVAERHAMVSAYGAPRYRRFLQPSQERCVKEAFHAACLAAYAEGFAMLHRAGLSYREKWQWDFDLKSIARIWQGGCIVRAALLREIQRALAHDPAAHALLVQRPLLGRLRKLQRGWRTTVMAGVKRGIPLPAYGGLLAFFDSSKSGRLPANLIQAIRDYFGRHGFTRRDKGGICHLRKNSGR